MSPEAWMTLAGIVVTIMIAVIGGCAAWMTAIYNRFTSIDQHLGSVDAKISAFFEFREVAKTSIAELYESRNNHAHRLTTVEGTVERHGRELDALR